MEAIRHYIQKEKTFNEVQRLDGSLADGSLRAVRTLHIIASNIPNQLRVFAMFLLHSEKNSVQVFFIY